jgi:hypothetical protein
VELQNQIDYLNALRTAIWGSSVEVCSNYRVVHGPGFAQLFPLSLPPVRFRSVVFAGQTLPWSNHVARIWSFSSLNSFFFLGKKNLTSSQVRLRSDNMDAPRRNINCRLGTSVPAQLLPTILPASGANRDISSRWRLGQIECMREL